LRILFLSPLQAHRWNWGHQLFRNEVGRHVDVTYLASDTDISVLNILKKVDKPDIIATYGYKYTIPYKDLDKINIPKVNFVCDYTPDTLGFHGFEKRYDQLILRDKYDFLFPVTYRVEKILKRKYPKTIVKCIPFGFDSRKYTGVPHNKRAIDVSTCFMFWDAVYPTRKEIQSKVKGLPQSTVVFTDQVFREQFVNVLHKSKINVNGLSYLKDSNMKIFEVMGCGCLCLTEKPSDLDKLGFVDGKHLVTFTSPDDMVDKIQYYLKHPAILQSIAKGGFQEVQQKHTNKQRVQQFLTEIEKGI